MQLNWSTFVLEIINFLILVWVLKRLFYVPIKKIIAKRKESIAQSLAEANKLHDEALQLKGQYENRLSDWNKEKTKKSAILRQELAAEKTKALDDLKATLASEREKNRAQEERKLQDIISKTEQQAELKATKIAAKLLQQFGSAETEDNILKLFLDQLPKLPAEKISLLKNELANREKIELKVVSAYELKKPQENAISSAFKKLFGDALTYVFTKDKELIAGLNVTIGAIILHANLRDELKFFSETPFHE